MELSFKERLILTNQYEILAGLSKNDFEIRKNKNLAEIFKKGYSRNYCDATSDFSEELSPEECQFVVDVLDLYRDLYWSWEKSTEIQDSIEKRNILFPGFDMNDPKEVRYLTYCRFMVEDQGKWGEIKQLIDNEEIEGLNSHGSGPTIEQLQLMIEKRKTIRNENNKWAEPLSLEEIKDILA